MQGRRERPYLNGMGATEDAAARAADRSVHGAVPAPGPDAPRRAGRRRGQEPDPALREQPGEEDAAAGADPHAQADPVPVAHAESSLVAACSEQTTSFRVANR